MEENVIQINGGMSDVGVDVSVRNIVYMKEIMFEILLHVVVKVEKIYQVLRMIQQSRVMKLKSHTTKKQKQF